MIETAENFLPQFLSGFDEGGSVLFYFDWTMLLALPGLILGLWAQMRVKSSFAQYSRVYSRRGVRAEDVSADLLHRSGNQNVTITGVSGSLTDHYDPSTNTLRLSQDVLGNTSIAAIGVAAHECGHAMQQHDGYAPLKLRTAIVPVVNIGSSLYFPIFMAGLLFSWEPLVNVGILCFALSLVFSLVTLPVEFDASKRAIAMLRNGGYLAEDELDGARKVLNAAAMTYVAAVVSSLLQLLRLILIARSRDD
ncbi:MAG: zinc metallopeptidase [Clostridia bacterium]|nr:zinc metallopeptidase [Clostridia bacterium]